MFWKKDKKETYPLFTPAGETCKGVRFLDDAFSEDALFWILCVDDTRNKNLLEGPTGDLEEAIAGAIGRNLPYAIFKTDYLTCPIKGELKRGEAPLKKISSPSPCKSTLLAIKFMIYPAQ